MPAVAGTALPDLVQEGWEEARETGHVKARVVLGVCAGGRGVPGGGHRHQLHLHAGMQGATFSFCVLTTIKGTSLTLADTFKAVACTGMMSRASLIKKTSIKMAMSGCCR